MTKILNIMEDFCHLRKYSYCRLDGAMKVEDRKEQVGIKMWHKMISMQC